MESHLVDPRIAYIQAVHWVYNQKQTEQIVIPLETCQIRRHFSQKDYDLYMSYKLNISNYFCFDPNYNLSLFYDREQNSGSFIYLYIVKCVNSTLANKQCLDIDKVETALSAKTYYLSYNIDTVKINL